MAITLSEIQKIIKVTPPDEVMEVKTWICG